LIVIDECHLSITKRRLATLDLWSDALRLGATATPTRGDGRALGIGFDQLVDVVGVAELTRQGFLAPSRYFAPTQPDLNRVGIIAGDYNSQQLGEVMNVPLLVADVVQTWLDKAPDRRTAVFAVNIKHSIALAEAFQRHGVSAEHADCRTPTRERDAAFARFTSGETQVFCNVDLATMGFDLPELDCVVLARPTKSIVRYLQPIGRGSRPAEGKTDCIVLDHAGCVAEHGFAHELRHWTLEGKRALEGPRKAVGGGPAEPIVCANCSAVFQRTRTCPECGHINQPTGKMIDHVDGELVEVGPHDHQPIDHRTFYLELLGIARERDYRDGFAYHKFFEKFNAKPEPSWRHLPPLAPSAEVRRWVRSRQIAYAKSQQRAS
jgi:superfamily II DNA or RNA helicase